MQEKVGKRIDISYFHWIYLYVRRCQPPLTSSDSSTWPRAHGKHLESRDKTWKVIGQPVSLYEFAYCCKLLTKTVRIKAKTYFPHFFFKVIAKINKYWLCSSPSNQGWRIRLVLTPAGGRQEEQELKVCWNLIALSVSWSVTIQGMHWRTTTTAANSDGAILPCDKKIDFD